MKTLLFLILSTYFTFSQNDTLLEAIKYYPLQNGNYWEYANHYWEFPYYDDSSFFSKQVIGDTILPNNKDYKILLEKRIPDDGSKLWSYERIDSSTACVYRFSDDSIFVNNEYLMDSLLAQPGDYFAGSYWGDGSTPGIFLTLCMNEYKDTVLAYPTVIKEFEDESGIPAINYLLAKGFGFINSSGCEFGCGITNLRYAKIDGVEYGTQITRIDDKTYNQPKSHILYQNYPNPFNPITKISWQFPVRSLQSLKVYDVLGNEVVTLVNEEKSAGYYEVDFDGSRLASGIYFYVLRSGDFVQSRKMLLLK